MGSRESKPFKVEVVIKKSKESEKDSVVIDSVMADICRNVENNNSLMASARVAEIAYTAAWRRLQIAESVLGAPLIEGQRGHGSKLTAMGKKMLALYDEAEGAARESIEQSLHKK